MRNFCHIASGADVVPLLHELKRQPRLWDKNPVRLLPQGPHYETHDIWLRYKDETENKKSGDYSNFGDEHHSVWYPAYYALPAAKKLIFDLMRLVEGEALGGVLIYTVPPGAQIHPHVDKGWHVEFYEKYNICLQSNPKACFYYANADDPDKVDERMFARPGDVHWFRNDVSHGVVNLGDEDHIILTVCIRNDRHELRDI